jgi:thiol:disulfide interchange protein DsbA
MKIICLTVMTALLSLGIAGAAEAAPAWTEGVNYFLIEPARPASLPKGKVEVTEVFSYGCPACNQFVPTMQKLKQSLPANAVLDYLPASFNPSEDWPMFELAFCTAQTLGIADAWHVAMFDAVWSTGELAIVDPATGRVKARLPTLEDVARFYNRVAAVPVEKFVSTSKSFGVDMKVRAAQDLVQAYRIDRTPTIVVDGKYRLHTESAGGNDQLIELVKWLVAKESK